MADSVPLCPKSPGSDLPSPKAKSSPSPSQVQGEPKLNGSQTTETPETKTKDLSPTESSPDEDPEVLCDSCIDSPQPAVKSCLTCLVSFCDSHLRPHLENPKFSQHRLLEPLRDIERKTCELHQLPLRSYCLPDCACVCTACLQEEHRGHQCTSVEEARRDIERQLKLKHTDIIKTVATAENAINKLQANTVSIENSVTEARGVVEARLSLLAASLDRARRALYEVLEAEEKQALKQAEGIRVHLENCLSDLRKTQTDIQRISQNRDPLDFLQDYSTWRQQAPDCSLPGVHVGLTDSLNTFNKIIIDSSERLSHLLHSELLERVRQACSNDKSGLGIKTTVQAIVAAKHNQALPDPETRAELLQYCRPMSFDPLSAHKFLRLTEENRKVTNTTPWQHAYPEHAERFLHFRQVVALESIYLCRAYLEVDFSGEGTYLGVCYKSMERKGSDADSSLVSSSASWCLQWTGRGFSSWRCGVENPLPLTQRFTRIGLYLDYSGGLLRFYGVQGEGESTSAVQMCEFRADFLEPLYPAFWLSKKENTVTLVPPGEPLPSPPSALQFPLSSPPGTPTNGTPTPPLSL